MARSKKTAYVIGSGPNGLTAAITLAQAGYSVTVLEEQPTPGGGVRTAELTLPGFLHDVGSAVYPMALSSWVFESFPLTQYGLEWIQPSVPVAHPMDDGSALLLEGSVERTADQFGPDRVIYRNIVAPLVARWKQLARDLLAPIHFPSNPVLFSSFGALAAWPAAALVNALFRTSAARAFFAGHAAHSVLPLEWPGSAAFGWVMMLSAHAVGWPVPRGGAQAITRALVSYLESLGGEVILSAPVRSLRDLDRDAGPILCDISPRQLLAIAGGQLPESYAHKLQSYRYGPGIFKMDWALNAPIPWTNSSCARSATVHIGGTLEEIARSERAAWDNRIEPRPFVLLAQPSLFDSTRAPEGKHTAWAYCHVPNGSAGDRTTHIEDQIERYAPGFRSRILARRASGPGELERINANLIGGDIVGGAADLSQLFLRPTASLYRTPVRGLYLCSSSTPPGGGVHGLCGYYAAQAVLKDKA